jgi:hypothetical protein
MLELYAHALGCGVDLNISFAKSLSRLRLLFSGNFIVLLSSFSGIVHPPTKYPQCILSLSKVITIIVLISRKFVCKFSRHKYAIQNRFKIDPPSHHSPFEAVVASESDITALLS